MLLAVGPCTSVDLSEDKRMHTLWESVHTFWLLASCLTRLLTGASAQGWAGEGAISSAWQQLISHKMGKIWLHVQVTMDAEAIQSGVDDAANVQQLSADALRGFEPVVELLSMRVDEARGLLPLLLPLTSKALRERHWDQIIALLSSVRFCVYTCMCTLIV